MSLSLLARMSSYIPLSMNEIFYHRRCLFFGSHSNFASLSLRDLRISIKLICFLTFLLLAFHQWQPKAIPEISPFNMEFKGIGLLMHDMHQKFGYIYLYRLSSKPLLYSLNQPSLAPLDLFYFFHIPLKPYFVPFLLCLEVAT